MGKKTMDTFQAEQDPSRTNAWRVVRVQANGERFPLSQRFNKERTAQRRAYELQVSYERRVNRPIYVGD
jgi:hypothetical protein